MRVFLVPLLEAASVVVLVLFLLIFFVWFPSSHNTKVNRKNWGGKKKQEAEERVKLWLLDGGQVWKEKRHK